MHKHDWCDTGECSCGKRRCEANRLASVAHSRYSSEILAAQVVRCIRAAEEQSEYCERHRYLQRFRGKRLPAQAV